VNSNVEGTDWALAVGVGKTRVAIKTAISFLDILIR
jgi:hypothetical protein